MSSTTPSVTTAEDRQRALLVELAALEVEDAQLYARRMVLRAEMDGLWNTDVFAQEQFGVLELAGTARIGQTRASTQLINGTRLVQTMPGTLAALRSGEMYSQTAVLLLELTVNCSDAVVQELEKRLLPTICAANTTEVRRLLLTMIPEVEADLDPELTEERLARARAGRHVRQSERPDAMVAVIAEIDAVAARRWALDFEELVRAQKLADDRAGIVRTQDQRRADVFAQLPSRFLALLLAVRNGQTEQLLALALADPDLADDLEALAATLPPQPDTEALAEDSPEPFDGVDAVPDTESHEPSETEHLPLPLEPPPAWAWARDPDPPDPALPWTDLSQLELAALVMRLPVNNPTVLNAHIPMTTLLELDHRTGLLDGGGALPAAHARLLVPHATLRRVFTDPDSGVPIGIDPHLFKSNRPATRPASLAGQDLDRLLGLLTPFTLRDQTQPRHDPSDRLRGLVELRDQQCTGPGCSRPAGQCHLDHEQPYPQGPTAAWNLSAKSARCHRAKHAGWTTERHGPGPRHGQTTWTSPLGHTYTRLSPWTHLPAKPSQPSEPSLDVYLDLASHSG